MQLYSALGQRTIDCRVHLEKPPPEALRRQLRENQRHGNGEETESVIFDSPEIEALRQKYEGQPDFRVPRIVQLDRGARLKRERELLESLAAKATSLKQREWASRLLSEDDGEHLATWFELHLLDWLLGVGETQVEPDIGGEKPDFLVTIGDAPVVVEARAVLTTDEGRRGDRATNEVFYGIHQLDLPYLVEVHDIRMREPFPTEQFTAATRQWLTDSPEQLFVFEDGLGNRVAMSVEGHHHLTRTQAVRSGPVLNLTGDRLRSPLKKKASQHRKLRAAGQPYVIALFLEDFLLDSEEVVDAWFGKVQVQIRVRPLEVISQSFDLSGLHFFGQDIVHTTVSGTLVFKHWFNEDQGVYFLRGHYVENPYAKSPLDPALLPVARRFVIESREPLRMTWRD